MPRSPAWYGAPPPPHALTVSSRVPALQDGALGLVVSLVGVGVAMEVVASAGCSMQETKHGSSAHSSMLNRAHWHHAQVAQCSTAQSLWLGWSHSLILPQSCQSGWRQSPQQRCPAARTWRAQTAGQQLSAPAWHAKWWWPRGSNEQRASCMHLRPAAHACRAQSTCLQDCTHIVHGFTRALCRSRQALARHGGVAVLRTQQHRGVGRQCRMLARCWGMLQASLAARAGCPAAARRLGLPHLADTPAAQAAVLGRVLLHSCSTALVCRHMHARDGGPRWCHLLLVPRCAARGSCAVTMHKQGQQSMHLRLWRDVCRAGASAAAAGRTGCSHPCARARTRLQPPLRQLR
jgi:hypothetical protein